MSYKLTAQVVETFNQNLTAVEKLVLAVLASFADKLGRNVFPSLTEVARRGCCSKRAVERAMARLRVLGVLHYDERGKGRKGRTRRYRFNIERAEALFVAGAVSPDTQSEGNDRETEEGTDKTTEVADNETVCAAKLSGVPPP